MASTDSKVLGVVLLVRHGDRQGFYQDADSYTPSNTTITPLGNKQEFLLGQQLRDIYLNDSSSSRIAGINATIVNDAQFRVRADAGGEGGVIYNSALSLLQGLFPANPGYETTLANGTTVEGPLGGYQYIPVESVEPENDISLEGWTSCNTFTTATNLLYNSSIYTEKAAENQDFLKSLPPYLDGRPVTLQNMWNIFDFMNVQYIHNPEFRQKLPNGYIEKARDLANFHEYTVFSGPTPDNIRNIAGQTIIPSVVEGFNSITDSQDPVKFVYQAISYKPFISLFNITRAAEINPQLAGIVNYAAALALEVRQPASGGSPVVRFNFKNGSEETNFTTYKFLDPSNSGSDVLLSDLIDYIKPFGIDSINKWCSTCSNTKDRGCAVLDVAAQDALADSHPKISPVGAGFLGAGLTLAVALLLLGGLLFMGILTVAPGKLGRKRSRSSDVETSPSMDNKA